MKQLGTPKTKRIGRGKFPKKNRKQKAEKAKVKHGRWSIEEHKLFENNYIAYLQKKITRVQLKNCIPGRTPAQTHCHLNKKKYELDRKFCAVNNNEVLKQILSLKEFFENERIKNSAKVTQLIYLRDDVKKKNYVISLENFVLLKKFFPSKPELKLDFQAVHNFLLATKTEREYTEMLQRHEAEMKRETSYLGRKLDSKSDGSSTLNSSLNTYSSSSSMTPSKLRTPSGSCLSENYFCTTQKENYEYSSALNDNKFSDMRTADCTPIETKIPAAAAAAASDKTPTTNPNFISDFCKGSQEERAEAVRSAKFFMIKNQKCLNFTSDETSENSNNHKENKNKIKNYYFKTDASKVAFNTGKSFACENYSLPKNRSSLNKGSQDFNLFFQKNSSKAPQAKNINNNTNNADHNLDAFINFNPKQKLNYIGSLDDSDSFITFPKRRTSIEASSDVDSFLDLNCDFSRPNTENTHLDDEAFFLGNQNENKNNSINTSVFNNPFNFSFGKNFDQQDLGNKDASVLFNNLIFSLCSKSKFNNTKANLNSINNNNNLIDGGLTSDFYNETQNALLDSNPNWLSGNNCNNFLFSANNANSNNCFNSLYPVEAEFYRDNSGYKFDQHDNFLC